MKRMMSGKGSQPSINIVIVNYKVYEDTIDCVKSILSSDYNNCCIFIVDNNSNNNSLSHIQEELLKFKPTLSIGETKASDVISNEFKINLIQSKTNNGFAAGNNIVLKRIIDKDEYLLLLNPDNELQVDTLKNLVECAQKEIDSNKVILGGHVKSYETGKTLCYGGGRINYFTGTVKLNTSNNVPSIDYVTGGFLFTHNKVLRINGLLPEDYFLYWEETDWCHQAKKNGCRIRICESAICLDKGSTSIGKGEFAEKYYTSNGLKFLSKNGFRQYILTATLYAFLRLTRWLFLFRIDRAKGIFLGLKRYYFGEDKAIS